MAVTAACGGSADLETLRSEEIANVTLPAARQMQRTGLPGGETLGKPSPAVLQLRFIGIEGATLGEVLAEAVAQARDPGWILEQLTRTFSRGTRTSDDGGVLTLEVYRAGEPQVGIVQLSR